MAAKLQCEICGGKLIGRPGGIYECDSCGMEYDTAWAKAKIQEITGTVKVEGTVEVTGKVQIDGPVKVECSTNKEALLQRGQMALEDGDWDAAENFFNLTLNLDAKCAEAFLGLAMAESRSHNREDFSEVYTRAKSEWRKLKHVLRARQFDGELDSWLEKLDEYGRMADEEAAMQRTEKIQKAIEKNRLKEQQLAEQKEKEQERLALRKVAIEKAEMTLPPIRAQIACASGLIAASERNSVYLRPNGLVAGTGIRRDGKKWGWYELPHPDAVAVATGAYTYLLLSDGTVLCTNHHTEDPSYYKEDRVEAWRDIKAISASKSHVLGLQKDGRVIAIGYNYFGACDVDGWRDVTAIAGDDKHSLGLKADGTVTATKVKNRQAMPNPSDVGEWRDIVAIAAGGGRSLGLRRDGTVVKAGFRNNSSWDDWFNIVAIDLGEEHAVGLRADGSVIAAGNNRDGQCNVENWRDMSAVAAGAYHTIGLRRDGTLLATGKNGWGQCDVNGTRIFPSYDSLPELRTLFQKKIALETEQLKMQPGFFTAKKRKEIDAQLEQIEIRIRQLTQNG